MTNLKLNTPIKLNEKEICECCGEPAYFEYCRIDSSSESILCLSCLKIAQEDDKKLLEEKAEAIEEEKKRDKIYNLIEETGDAIESLLLNNNIVYNKIKSLMSASVYFEFEVGGVDKKIRISDHEARYTYNILNGYSNFNIAVGYESGECNFSVFESEEIEEVTSILNKIYFNK